MRRQTATGFDDRVRFNWGYHDAALEAARDRRRTVVKTGNQTTETVSDQFDRAYAAGYREGLKDFDNNQYEGNSQAAWDRQA